MTESRLRAAPGSDLRVSNIVVRGASEHNLKQVSLEIPREALTVFTGVSGSGKSSLAFDTIYKEGQRRFLESLSAYARQFLGGFEKPRVESIEGLSPTISIDQKTVGRSPRSTVGTITEIHDYLRLLFARLGEPHCPGCGKPVASQSAEQICDRVFHLFAGKTLLVLAPLVRGRKGEHRQLLEDLKRDGYARVRIDGSVFRLSEELPALRKHERHTVDVVCDRLEVQPELRGRWTEAIERSLGLTDGTVAVCASSIPAPPSMAEPGTLEERFSSKLACPGCGISLPELEPRLFSFNSHHGACKACDGLGETDQVDPELLIVDPSLPFKKGGLAGMLSTGEFAEDELDTRGFLELGKRLGFSPRSSWGDLTGDARKAVLHGDGRYVGLLPALSRIASTGEPGWIAAYLRTRPCEDCGGARLRPEARAVRFHGMAIHELSSMTIRSIGEWFSGLRLEGNEALVGEPVVKNVLSRLSYLEQVGLSYLALDRRSDTLAGGEAQRLRLASQVGAGLQGVLFVLDEPSIGLHPRDNRALLETLKALRDLGNTVLVVEHDQATMEAADHLVDVGPGAGPLGGEVVAQGTALDLAACPRSVTGQYLSGERSIPVPPRRRAPGKKWLELRGVHHNNLKDIDVRMPLGLLVVVTGVSGSGKSSLVNHVLRPALLQKLGRFSARPGKHRAILGWQHVDKVVDIDQSPIGRTPRSNPATYVKVFDLIRDLYAQVPEARARGYKTGRFSFNKDGGRCLECGGAGITIVEMQFLPAVEVTCDACAGKRYNRETLEIHYRAKSIHDVLEMTVSEAAELFMDHPRIHRPIEMLAKVGLGYMKLGQSSTTLSGGEAQRVKLAAELKRQDTGRTLYLFDEPTTGLHFEDIRAFLAAVDDLVSRGNTVIVIEHSTDVMKVADHIIDLGPEAGDGGGTLVAQGTPEEVSEAEGSYTGAALRKVLGGRGARGVSGGSTAKLAASIDRGDPRDIQVFGARKHNLKSVNVRIPRRSLTVITGVSGSGKTSLAFDTIFAEGERRYLESLSTYARRFLGRLQGAECDRITGLSPAIAIDQKSASSNPRSTVATITEIHDYLRLLYARVGKPHCPDCGMALAGTSPTRLAAELSAREPGKKAMILWPVRLAKAGAAHGRHGDLLRDVESLRSALLKDGFTRVLANGDEVRLDEEGDAAVRRMLAAFEQAALEKAAAEKAARLAEPGRASGNGRTRLDPPPILAVADRIVLGESSQTRLAGSLEQAFERGGGVAAVLLVGSEPVFHTRAPSCPAGHLTLEGELTPSLFSFSSLQGACPRCKGIGIEKRVQADRLVPSPERPVLEALDRGFRRFLETCRPSAFAVLRGVMRGRGIQASTRFEDVPEADQKAILHGTGGEKVSLELHDGTVFEAYWLGLIPQLEAWAGEGNLGAHELDLERLLQPQTCSGCSGGRLRPESLAVRVGDLGIRDLTALTVSAAADFVRGLAFTPRERTIALQVLVEIENRLKFLQEVGLGYLTLDRTAGTLSGGESQRIRLASQLGNRLAGVLYVLDEPTVGLHQRDTARLIESLKGLRDLGNTVLLVEHDRETMEAADWLIDIGPGAGAQGGRVVAEGTPADVARHPQSLTGRYLAEGSRVDDRRAARRPTPADWIELEGVTHNNLRGVRAAFPLGVFTAVSGVSGSGKSSLVLDVLAEALDAHIMGLPPPSGRVASIRGLEKVRRLVVVDQKPIGRSPRSNPATYTGVWDLVRELFAMLPSSRVRGYGPSRFSFNTGEGRCIACDGQGLRQIEMHFLSDVWVPCELCKGKRFNRETLAVLFKGKNIAQVLALEVDEACGFFESQPRILRILDTLKAVGLGYVRLGQPSNTLSGGEAQRVKLAAELVTRECGGSVYLLDEPTTGLHFEDVRRLNAVLQALVEGGNTLIVIEHHLDVIRSADWVIDLGPEAGDGGGRIVAEGPPDAIARAPESHTGKYLRERGRGVS